MNEVLGQEHAKWALQVAAAGGHNLIMTGPPGSGKNHVGLTYARHHVPVERGGTAGGGIDSIAVRHTASVRHHRHAAVRGTAPHRQHGGLGGWWQRHRRSRRNHTRIEAFCFWTRHRNSAHAPRRRCANHWNPGMWRFPVQKAAPTTRPHSNSSWRPTPVRADTITAPANVALAGKKDRIRYFSRLSGPILDRVDIQMAVPPVSRIAAQKASQSASPVPGYKLV